MNGQELLHALVTHLAQCEEGEGFEVGPEVAACLLWRPHLTPREVEVLACLAAGLTFAEIATELTITVRTARTHGHHITRALQCDTARSAGMYAVVSGRVTAAAVLVLWRRWRPWFFEDFTGMDPRRRREYARRREREGRVRTVTG